MRLAPNDLTPPHDVPIQLPAGRWYPGHHAHLSAWMQQKTRQEGPKIAAFDWDNTCIFNDIGDAVWRYQLDRLQLRLDPRRHAPASTRRHSRHRHSQQRDKPTGHRRRHHGGLSQAVASHARRKRAYRPCFRGPQRFSRQDDASRLCHGTHPGPWGPKYPTALRQPFSMATAQRKSPSSPARLGAPPTPRRWGARLGRARPRAWLGMSSKAFRPTSPSSMKWSI